MAGSQAFKASSIPLAVLSNSARSTEASLELPIAVAASSVNFNERRLESRYIIGHKFVNKPRRISTVPKVDFNDSGPSNSADWISSGGGE
jgi:hypothetical protein